MSAKSFSTSNRIRFSLSISCSRVRSRKKSLGVRSGSVCQLARQNRQPEKQAKEIPNDLQIKSDFKRFFRLCIRCVQPGRCCCDVSECVCACVRVSVYTLAKSCGAFLVSETRPHFCLQFVSKSSPHPGDHRSILP